VLNKAVMRRARRLTTQRVLALVPPTLLVLVVVVPIGLFAWLFFYTDVFMVQAVTVVDARQHTTDAARDIINSQLSRNPLGHNIFFVQTEVLEADIEAELAQVKDAHVIRKLPGTIKVIIQEKTPALLLLSNGQYYFVDQQGVPYEKASLETLPGIVLPTVKNDDQNAVVTLGASIVESSFVSFLESLQEGLPETIGSEVAEIHIPSLSAREVHVVLDTTRGASSQLDLLSQLLGATISADVKNGLEYIDLRIPNRIYYRSTAL
jgi:hypothetical protein